MALLPDQPPLALQLVAFSTDQLNVAGEPLSMLELDVLSETFGGPALMVTATEPLTVPPGPVQEREKEVSAVKGPTVSLPPVPLAPLQPPLAAQLSASVEDQLRVVEPPFATLAALALKDNVGD